MRKSIWISSPNQAPPEIQGLKIPHLKPLILYKNSLKQNIVAIYISPVFQPITQENFKKGAFIYGLLQQNLLLQRKLQIIQTLL